MLFPAKFKSLCIACGAHESKMNKEHYWPRWLIARTATHRTSVRFNATKRVNPKKLTIPLCVRCNTDFGRELEAPTSRIFTDIEANRGVSDIEAELLVRWLWKFEGIAWLLGHPQGMYSDRYTLRDRVLLPIDDIRSQLTLAIALASEIDAKFGDAPMGIDSHTEQSAVFVAGVFSKIALMVLDRRFEEQVPPQFGLYRLAPLDAPDRTAKLFFPPTGFATCVEAVNVTARIASFLSYLHDTRT